MRIALATLCTALLCVSSASAIEDAVYDQLTGFTTVVGRAAACDIDVSDVQVELIGWVNREFGEERQLGFDLYLMGLTMSAKAQQEGTSGVDCNQVALDYAKFSASAVDTLQL